LIAETNTKSLLKNPANGGTPHIEKSINANEKATKGFEINKPDKSFMYFNLLCVPFFLIDNKIKVVRILKDRKGKSLQVKNIVG
jgi:hypothetical protein